MTGKQKDLAKGSGYSTVLSEFKIGPVTLPNRIAFPAWQLNYANTDGTVSDKLMKFYTDLAKGGCGLIFTGAAVVTSDGVPFDRVMHVDTDEYVPGLKKLFSAIKESGAVPAIQLVHYGRQSSTEVSGDVLRAPSAIPCPVMSQYDPDYKVKAMTLGDIEEIREAFISAAIRSAGAGVEVVEVHACHGYLLNEFLSSYSNKRSDRYGGSAENRARLIVEILEGIRKQLDDKIALTVRISGDEFVEGGLKAEDYKEILPMFENAGIDFIDISAGVYESMERIVPPKSLGLKAHMEVIKQIRTFAAVPVCAVGSIFTLEAAEEILVANEADICSMGRAQMSDPATVTKSAAGRESEISKCLHCNSCTFWTTGDPEVYCTVNPDYKKPKAD
ncbi:MAG: NADH:flavin oxidoreductase [bacterium]|nr:NADH:flavin oxidoreductase [bacterium]